MHFLRADIVSVLCVILSGFIDILIFRRFFVEMQFLLLKDNAVSFLCPFLFIFGFTGSFQFKIKGTYSVLCVILFGVIDIWIVLVGPLKWQPPPQSPGTTIEGPHDAFPSIPRFYIRDYGVYTNQYFIILQLTLLIRWSVGAFEKGAHTHHNNNSSSSSGRINKIWWDAIRFYGCCRQYGGFST